MLSIPSISNGWLRICCGLCIAIFFAGTLGVFIFEHTVTDFNDPYRCNTLLERGRWSHDFESRSPYLEWHPGGCMLRSYDAADAAKCLKQLTIIGDSTARQLFWALADKLNSRAKVSTGSLELSPLIARHANMSLEVGGGRELHFIWDPYLNDTSLSRFPTSLAKVVVISGGLWQARYLDEHHLRMFERHLTRLVAEYYKTNDKNCTASLPETRVSNRPIFVPISPPFQPSLDSNRSETMTPERISAIDADLKMLAKDLRVDVM